jgi:hypothetical protein
LGRRSEYGSAASRIRHSGKGLTVDFDLKGKAIRLFAVSKTTTGKFSVRDMKQAKQKVFSLTLPVLADATFDTGTDDVTLTIANNGGTGNIQILRQLGSDEFAQIDEITPVTTSYVDSPTIDGTYTYKLTQTGQTGESNSKSVVASTIGAGAGTTPDTLSGSFDGTSDVSLAWVNHGGTGNVIVEKRVGPFSSWEEIASLAAATTTYDDGVVLDPEFSFNYYYRVKNTSASGYSNTLTDIHPYRIMWRAIFLITMATVLEKILENNKESQPIPKPETLDAGEGCVLSLAARKTEMLLAASYGRRRQADDARTSSGKYQHAAAHRSRTHRLSIR